MSDHGLKRKFELSPQSLEREERTSKIRIDRPGSHSNLDFHTNSPATLNIVRTAGLTEASQPCSTPPHASQEKADPTREGPTRTFDSDPFRPCSTSMPGEVPMGTGHYPMNAVAGASTTPSNLSQLSASDRLGAADPGVVQLLNPSMIDVAGNFNIHYGHTYIDSRQIFGPESGNIDDMQKSLFQHHLKSWPSWKAVYDADIGEMAAFTRGPCTQGTRVDVLRSIHRWAMDSSSDCPRVFLLMGQAGSGKSTIAYTIARDFDANANQNGILGANFFCSRLFEETRLRRNIIPTIVYQLARRSRSYAHALLRADKFDSVHFPSKQMEDLLVGPWVQSAPELSSYLVVVDALDEIQAGEGSAFLRQLLKTINQGHLRRLKFLVTCRSGPDFIDLCSSFVSEAVYRLYEVPTDTLEADITKYLTAALPAVQGEPQLAELARKADGLFIYAATVVRYIRPRVNMTKGEQLTVMRLLCDHGSSIPESTDAPSLIDELYQQILRDAFRGLSDTLIRNRLRILHTLLCTAERVSASVAERLLSDTDAMKDMAKVVVDDLHAVLYIKDDRVLWYHASFPDFIFSPERSTFKVSDALGSIDMSCNEEAHHSLLTHSCFAVMKSDLRFNICSLQSSFLLDSEVPDLSRHVQETIGDALKYSCYYWARHLTAASHSSGGDGLRSRVRDFLHVRVLFWIEAMNLLGSQSAITPLLQQAHGWILDGDKHIGCHSDLARDVSEMTNFATYFTGSPAAQSTPHLYISSLTTWPSDSSISQVWKHQFSCVPSLKQSGVRNTLPLMMIQHSSAVQCIACSNDGTHFVSGSDDKSVRVWDASTGMELRTLNGHTGAIWSVAFSSDDTRIASCSEDKSVRLWDASAGVTIWTLNGHLDAVLCVAFSSDGTRIVSGSGDQSVQVWDTLTGVALRKLDGHKNMVWSVVFSSDGTYIASGSDDQSVRVWDALTGRELKTLNGHTGSVWSVAFFSDGIHIVSGSADSSLRIWDASTGVTLRTLNGHTAPVCSVAVSSDGTRIVSGSDDQSVRVWDASTAAELRTLNGHMDSVWSVAFSSDGIRIVSGSTDGSLRVWDASKGMLPRTHDRHMGSVLSVAFSGDGTRIVSGSYDNSVRIWDTLTGMELMRLNEHTSTVFSVAFSSDCTRIVSGSDDNSVRIWDALSGMELRTLSGHTDTVWSVAFVRDCTRIVSGSQDQSIRLWDASTGVELRTLKGHLGPVHSVAFSSDGTHIVSGSADKSVRIWDARTGKKLRTLNGHTDAVQSVAFSSDGTCIVSGSDDKSVRVWDSLTGKKLKMLNGHMDTVQSVAFSSDGTRIVSGSDDKSVRIWDAFTGMELRTLNGHADAVWSVAFSSDGTRIVSGSYDQSVRVWNASTGMEPRTSSEQTCLAQNMYRGLTWTCNPQGWILWLPYQKRLMWVPLDIQKVLLHPFILLIIPTQEAATIDFEHSRVGSDWAECYIPSPLLASH